MAVVAVVHSHGMRKPTLLNLQSSDYESLCVVVNGSFLQQFSTNNRKRTDGDITMWDYFTNFR